MNFDDQIKDGSGKTIRQAARELAIGLNLDPGRTAWLVADLRNALVPVHIRHPGPGTAFVLALAEELARLQNAT